MTDVKKIDASLQPAQRSVEAARAERAQMRAQGLRRGNSDEAPRIILAEPIPQESESVFKKRVNNDDELKHLRI